MSLVCVGCCLFVFFFKQKTAYEMRISDWSSDVCSSDLAARVRRRGTAGRCRRRGGGARHRHFHALANPARDARRLSSGHMSARLPSGIVVGARSEEHTSELQSIMRISYAVFCLKKKTRQNYTMIN